MRFKRSTLRYGETPQPATPYQKAAQVWDERIGSARAQARNWRLMALGCLGISLLLAVGLVWLDRSGAAVPFVVEVERNGTVRAVGPAGVGAVGKDKIRAAYGVPEEFDVLSGITVGYQGDPDALPEELPGREKEPRARKPLADIAFSGAFGTPAKLG